MDIQLPVMSGIEATKEIRRLERVNHIGVFSEETTDKPSPEDELGDLPFPSPVIIVALTASSRESDRNEALAAGCNDFLTKPVGAPWLERKAIEWGCMQALIWTSFERKKRKGENCGVEGKEKKEEKNILGEDNEEAPSKEEKPVVYRGDSGESLKTRDSEDTDEGQAENQGT
jgi:osomolarity two-component system response regulator SSK1